MADEQIRAYYELNTTAPRTANQWSLLKTAARNKPMILALRNAGSVLDQPHLDVIMQRFDLTLQRMIVRFCVDPSDVTALTIVLNDQCIIRAITGTTRQKFRSLLEAELREAIVDIGFTPVQAALMNVIEIGFANASNRNVAIEAANTYLVTNVAIWG